MGPPPLFSIAGHEILPGSRTRFDVRIGTRVTGAEVMLPIEVVAGASEGPRLFVCAAVHGDEISGVEIIRRVLRRKLSEQLRGSLIAAPILNVFGFAALTRYLPDRRDLNRSFPGSPEGPLASRIAHIFLTEIVANATHGIDLHSGAIHRSNLPQIRACLDDAETMRIAKAFGVPVVINANVRDGSLRQAVLERGIPMLLYEGGEALRFSEPVIRAGTRGILAVMRDLGMLPPAETAAADHQPYIAQSSFWIRAPESGILRARAELGANVEAGERVGVIADPLGTRNVDVTADKSGIVIGRTELPLVNEGDAVFNVASFERPKRVASRVEDFHVDLEDSRGIWER